MNSLLDRSKTFLNHNAAAILTCVGGVGVVATSVMAVKATPKALTLLKDAEEKKGEKLTKTEIVKVAGPIYIPSVVVGVSTIASTVHTKTIRIKSKSCMKKKLTLRFEGKSQRISMTRATSSRLRKTKSCFMITFLIDISNQRSKMCNEPSII